MHSRVAAAMRARAQRLRQPPARDPPPRPRGFRRSRLRLLILAGIAAALFLLAAFEIGILADRHGSVVDGGDFTLCARSSRQNCVVDGDTIRVNGEPIRIIGIDAPETRDAECDAERALANVAAKRLLELVNAGPFELVGQGGRDRDKHGRKLLAIERNGRSLGDVLVAEGLAHRWDGRQHSWCG
jgi:endonuclease YncB( thermonuclease family)